MKNKILISVTTITIILLAGIATAFTSYGNITGYATVEQAITLDIIGSSNDINYTLKDVRQGETEYSPKIKIYNRASDSINIEILLTSSSPDVALSVIDENKTETLSNPMKISPGEYYVYVKHDFSPSIEPGNYTFNVEVSPIEKGS